MPSTVFGLPTHALLVHATVVLIPLAALAVLLHAFWPAARRRLGVVTPLLAGVALVLTPLSTESGEQLEHQVPESALVDRHAELADGLLPWVIGLFVVAVGLWLLQLQQSRSTDPVGGSAVARLRGVALPRWVPAVALVLAVVAAAGTIQQVVRVGHAGAKATWNEVVQQPAAGADRGGDED
jgi:hypothetical protein